MPNTKLSRSINSVKFNGEMAPKLGGIFLRKSQREELRIMVYRLEETYTQTVVGTIHEYSAEERANARDVRSAELLRPLQARHHADAVR